jgi:hypothetical protein
MLLIDPNSTKSLLCPTQAFGWCESMLHTRLSTDHRSWQDTNNLQKKKKYVQERSIPSKIVAQNKLQQMSYFVFLIDEKLLYALLY